MLAHSLEVSSYTVVFQYVLNTSLCENVNNYKQHTYGANTSVCENVILRKVKYVARISERGIL